MSDFGFIVAAYGVIIGGLATYAITLLRRLGAARHQGRETPDDASR